VIPEERGAVTIYEWAAMWSVDEVEERIDRMCLWAELADPANGQAAVSEGHAIGGPLPDW
jgi:hypothetical protein